MVDKKQGSGRPNTGIKRPNHTAQKGNQQARPARSKSAVNRGLLDRLGLVKKPTRSTLRYSAPDVLVRGTPVARRSVSKSASGRSSVRRRYDMNVPTVPEASISLPTLPAIKFSWRILSFGMAAGMLFALYTLWTSPLFAVNQIEYTGLQRLKAYDLNAVLDIIGSPSFMVVPDKMEQVLMDRFPALTSASVEIEFPNGVMVEINERTPLLVWMQAGRTDFVDAEGIAFPLGSEETEITQLGFPVVEAEGFINEQEVTPAEEEKTGLLNNILNFLRQEDMPEVTEPRQVISPEMVKAVLLLHDHAPQDSPLLYTESHGLAWKDQAGWMAYFGDGNHIEMKLRVYQTVLRYLSKKETIPELVSVEWVDAPYYRLEP